MAWTRRAGHQAQDPGCLGQPHADLLASLDPPRSNRNVKVLVSGMVLVRQKAYLSICGIRRAILNYATISL